MATPHIRRATEADAAAIAAIVPGLVPSATAERRATFVVDGDGGITAVLELVQADDHMLVEHFKAPDEAQARLLALFIDAAARGVGSKEIRLAPGAMDDTQARALGYRDGHRKVRHGHLEAIGEMWNLYTGDARLGGELSVSLSPDGRTLYVEGAYGLRSEDAVLESLAENKDIREVVLAGPGGRAATGFELFRMFRERKLATRVNTACASACTIAFLGGVERSIGPRGRLGFHRASFPSMGDSDMYESNRGIRRFLIYSARLTPEFADRVFNTPSDSIWVPTTQELLAGGVINRVNP